MQLLRIVIENVVYPVVQLPGRPKALLDRTVAQIYGVETREINQAVTRNPEKFPEDFCFELTKEEFEDVTTCDILSNIKYSRVLPKAFTHLGCNMLATVLQSRVAIKRSIQIIRAFTSLEEMEFALGKKFSEDQGIIRAIVNELTEIREEMKKQNQRLSNIEAALQKMRQYLANADLPVSPQLLPSDRQSESEQWISSRKAQVLKKLGKERGKTKKQMARMWSEFKSYFDIDRYIHLPNDRFQEALEWLQAWDAEG